ncbi:MAG: hypothetical protein Q8Q24_02215 [bacterium]|nr:hypothetical protein [bacterium]
MIKDNPRKKSSLKRKFFLPLFLILFILAVLGFNWIRNMNFGFNLNLTDKIVSPLPSLTRETALAQKLEEYGIAAKNLQVLGDSITATISGATTYFNQKEDILKQVVSLQYIISRAKIEGKIPKVIDLRFDKPIVSF